MVKPSRQRVFIVYRAYNADGILLYIGDTTRHFECRLPEHVRDKSWIAIEPGPILWTTTYFPSFDAMHRAQNAAIKFEHPKYNKQGKLNIEEEQRKTEREAKQQAAERKRAEQAERKRVAQEEARQQASRDRAKDHRTKSQKLDDMARDPHASESERTKAAAMAEKLRASSKASGVADRERPVPREWQMPRDWREKHHEWMENERQAQRDYNSGMYEQYAQERRGSDQPEQTWGPTYTARQQETWDRERERLQQAQKAGHPNWVYPKQADISENARRPPARDDGWWSPP